MFHDVLFPETYDGGAQLGPGFNTNIISQDSGYESRFSRWTYPRRKYRISYGVRPLDELSILKDFYHCRWGQAHTFRFKDLVDFTSAADGKSDPGVQDQVLIPLIDGSYFLQKSYNGDTRYITKPNGSVRLWDEGVEVINADGYINHLTGRVNYAFTGIASASFSFDVPVRFDGAPRITHVDYETGTLESIQLVEVRE